MYKTAKITSETSLRLGKDAWVGDLVFINLKQLTLGRGSQVNPFASLTGGGTVTVGEYSVIGYGVRIITGTDTPEGKYMADRAPATQRRIVRGKVTIGNNCFIGANSVISVTGTNPHVQIGDYAVIGAMSYVDESVSDRIIGWGIPFKARKKRRH